MPKILIHARERVINNFISGKNQSFIARKFNVSRGSVQKIIKKKLFEIYPKLAVPRSSASEHSEKSS